MIAFFPFCLSFFLPSGDGGDGDSGDGDSGDAGSGDGVDGRFL